MHFCKTPKLPKIRAKTMNLGQEKIRTLSRKAKLEVAAVIRAIPEQPLQSMAEGWRG
jgi:hypothetical protein